MTRGHCRGARGVALAVLLAVGAASCSKDDTLTAGRFNVAFANAALQAKADCNACAGAATLAGATLTVGPLACTRAACASAPLDTRFASLLDGPLTVRVNARLLQLNNATGGELRFEK
jgi:heat shock protein HslJ